MFHNIYVYGTPADVTPDDILASVMSEDENAFDGYTGGLMNTQTLSPGAVQYFYLDLQPGSHAAHCTESDGQGPPHFFMGMIVTVEGARWRCPGSGLGRHPSRPSPGGVHFGCPGPT